jgi:hypothetical protein
MIGDDLPDDDPTHARRAKIPRKDREMTPADLIKPLEKDDE